MADPKYCPHCGKRMAQDGPAPLYRWLTPTLRQQIRELRFKLNQDEIAAELGISQASVSRTLSGRRYG